jgi:hypothetical protein
MAFWIVFAFLLGLVVGAGGAWWLLGGPPLPAPPASSERLTLEPAGEVTEEVPDSMSLTAKRLVTDLERKYEGAVAGDDKDVAKPKRPRPKRARRPTAKDPADPADPA